MSGDTTDSSDDSDDISDAADADGNDSESEIVLDNQQLNEVLDFYDCFDLLPLAQRILWLYHVKEALGYIPPAFGLAYLDIQLLVILQDEQAKKVAHEQRKMKMEQRKMAASMPQMPQASRIPSNIRRR